MNIQFSTKPYPGLRPFKSYESDIFFGRDEHVKQLLEKFGKIHFVAVVGPSGYGKSSLVRTGLLASLELGFLETSKIRWRIADTHPGDNPLTGLVDALENAFEPKIDLQRDPTNVHRHLNKEKNENLLVFVDQFEEIFRYYPHSNRMETTAFVADLLKLSQHDNIYVVITIRSEFLGKCSQFYNLPEAINQGMFLVPRLDVQQLKLIIEGPARVFQGQVAPDLVERLLKDMEGGNNSDPTFDQLPLLQHVLMRMWSEAEEEAKKKNSNEITLTLVHYSQVGELKDALSKHANEAYGELTAAPPGRDNKADDKRPKVQQEIAETLFRSLSEPGGAPPDLRRPVKLGKVVTLVHFSQNQSEAYATVEKEVKAVVEIFRKEERDFLLPSPTEVPELTSDTVLDISHESLLRQWDKAEEWIKKETDQVNLYRWLKENAGHWNRVTAESGLWEPPNLDRALAWRNNLGGTEGAKEWAKRYDPSYDPSPKFAEEFQHTMTFLDKSDNRAKERQQEELDETKRDDRLGQQSEKPKKLTRLKNLRWTLYFILGIIMVLVSVMGFILPQEVLLLIALLEGELILGFIAKELWDVMVDIESLDASEELKKETAQDSPQNQ